MIVMLVLGEEWNIVALLNRNVLYFGELLLECSALVVFLVATHQCGDSNTHGTEQHKTTQSTTCNHQHLLLVPVGLIWGHWVGGLVLVVVHFTTRLSCGR